MSKSKISPNFNSSNDINNNITSKKTKSQNKKSPDNPQENLKKNIFTEENNKEELNNKSLYKTPYISKNNDKSYSKMEMPISYQLTNGKCIRLRNSQRNNNYDDYENEVNNIGLTMDSKSSNTTSQIIDNSFLLNKVQKKSSISKENNSLINYGKNKCIYPMKFVMRHQKKLIKEESQNVKSNIDNEFKTYKKFNLMINPSYKYNKKYISSPIHKYLPYCKKDDEKYKKNLISYIRNEAPTLDGGAKSVSCIYAKYMRNNENEKPKEDDIPFYFIKKKKKIFSTKKIYAAEKSLYSYSLINGKNQIDYEHPKKFRFYFDNDIGFNDSWQSPLIIANGDDDVETDDEVLSMAEEKCMEDLVEGINAWNKSSRLCRNFVLVKKLNKMVKTPTFNSIIKNKKNRINGIDNQKKNENPKNDCDNSIDRNIISFRK